MAVRGDNSLFFSTGLDNSGLQQGASGAVGIIQNLASVIGRINPFAGIAAGAVLALGTIASASYQLAKEFEKNLKEVETISKATQEDFKGIGKAIFDISENSVDGPAKLAKAYYQIVSAGYDGAAGLKLLKTASDAATAGVTTTEVAADGITTVLNAFKLEAEEADLVADSMFQTVKLGKTTFEELSSSLSQAAPLAAASGFSFQELLAAVASLTKQGVPTAQAMTQIRAGIISVTDVLGDGASKSLTLQGAFQAIYDKAGGSQKEIKELAGSIEAVNAILAVAGPNAEDAAGDLNQLGEAAGEAKKAFNSMASENGNQWSILKNRIASSTAEIGDAVLGMSSGIAKFLNDAADNSDNLVQSVRKQANEFNILRQSVEDTNVPFEDRIEILRDLQNQYPEYLSSLDLDKIKNDDLEDTLNDVYKALEKINDEQERRLKLSGANQKVANAENKTATNQGLYESSVQDFYAVIEELKDYAAKEDIELNFNIGDKPSQILGTIQRQLDLGFFENFGKGGRLVAALYEAENGIRVFKQTTGEANEELEAAEANAAALKVQLYDNVIGAVQITEEISKIKTLSDLEPFQVYQTPEIKEVVQFREDVIKELELIKLAESVESLKPFLDSEIKEIQEYAQKRYRILNKDYDGDGGNKPDMDEYRKKLDSDLKKIESSYDNYFTLVNQGEQETATKLYGSLVKRNANFGEYLKSRLSQAKNYAEKEAVVLSAEKAGIKLNREKASVVSTLVPESVVFDFKVEQSSINFIENQIKRLTAMWKAASEDDRPGFEKQLEYYNKRLEKAQGGANAEEELYSDVGRELSSMSKKALKDYIEYWQKRLLIAGLSADKEKEIEGKIADAQRSLWSQRIQEYAQILRDTAGVFREIGNDAAADLVEGLASAAMEMENIFKVLDENTSNEDRVQAGIQAAIQLTTLLIDSAHQRKQADEDYYNAVIAQQLQYNRLLNEQIRTQESATQNVFTRDFVNEMEQGLLALRDANAEYEDSLNALSSGQVQVGTRTSINLGNVLQAAGSGAALGGTIGMAVGSVVPLIGTAVIGAVGAVVGAVVGGVIGLFGARERGPEYTDLLNEYPELITTAENGQRSFNTVLAQTLLDQGLLNDATEVMIENTIEWQNQIDAAREQIKGVISDIAGGLGDELRNALVDAFQSGSDAAEAMGSTIEGVLQGVLEQLIFDEIFSAQFKKLEEQMAGSFDIGGDRNFIDDFAEFFNAAQTLNGDFQQALADARDQAEAAGFDLFQDTSSQREGLSGDVSRITEDTANILAGYVNAIRLDVRAGVEIGQQNSIYFLEIATNTRYNSHLESIDAKMATIENGFLRLEAQG